MKAIHVLWLSALAGCNPTIDASDIVSGTIDPARLPEQVATDGEVPEPVEPTTDAAALSTGTLSVDRLPAEVVLESELPIIPEHGVAGFSETEFSPSLTLDGVFTELMSVEVPVVGPVDVVFNSHFYVEKSVSSGLRYEFVIAADSCSGEEVGRTFWRPNTDSETSGFDATSLALSGFAMDVTGTTTFVVCGRKFDGAAPDATVYARAMTAHW